MHSQPPNQVESRKRVCEEAGKRVKTRPALVLRGTLATSLSYGTRSVPTTINVHLFLEFTIVGKSVVSISFKASRVH